MYWINDEDIPQVAKDCAEVLRSYLNKQPSAGTGIIADIIQASIEGWVHGTRDMLNQREQEMEDD